MEQNVKYSVIALAVLALAAIGVGIFYWGAKISASTQTSSNTSAVAVPSAAIPLKQGWNKITNGPRSIYSDSEIVGVDGWLKTVAEAKKEGLIGDLKTVDSNKVLGKDISKIDPNTDFYIYAIKVDRPLAVFPEKI